MLSQLLVPLPELGREESSLSEKIAIFDDLCFFVAVERLCCWCDAEGDEEANGSILAARAGLAIGRAGLVGSAASCGRAEFRRSNSANLRSSRSAGRASFSNPILYTSSA